MESSAAVDKAAMEQELDRQLALLRDSRQKERERWMETERNLLATLVGQATLLGTFAQEVLCVGNSKTGAGADTRGVEQE